MRELSGEIAITGVSIADRLNVSNQTASRRHHRLETANFLEREHVSDGQWITITDDGKQVLRAEYDEYCRLFGSNTEIELEGIVADGMGDGRHFVSLPGYERQFEDRLGYEPFPGTLSYTLTAVTVGVQ